jgi:hypothetical protein
MSKSQAETTFAYNAGFDSKDEPKTQIEPREDFNTYEREKYDLAASETTRTVESSKLAESKNEEVTSGISDFALYLRDESHRLPAEQIKEINRAVTRKLPQATIDEFIKERADLVKKKLDGNISTKEEQRLAFVRWQLDRVEDAIYGKRLDVLERITQVYEGFASEIKGFLSQVKTEPARRKKSRKR